MEVVVVSVAGLWKTGPASQSVLCCCHRLDHLLRAVYLRVVPVSGQAKAAHIGRLGLVAASWLADRG